MSTLALTTPVIYTMVVDRPVDEAFELFTYGMGRWWPRHRTFDVSPHADVGVELKLGGRWYAREPGEKAKVWGYVSSFDYARALLLDFRVDEDWHFHDHLHSTVEVSFRGEGETRARVDLQHRDLHNYDDRAMSFRHMLSSPHGWPVVFKSFAGLANAA